MSKPRYLVGIDLGTTNTVVAFCELSEPLNQQPIELFAIDQLKGPGEVVRKPLLPSFRYHPAPTQFSASNMTLPWENQVVEGDIPHAIIGEWARDLGARSEGRQVSSAKSWLSHTGVERTQEILPWAGAQDVEKVSPIIASASYLNHIRQSWNHRHPSHPLEEQDVVVTVPASFDESARKYTLEAATLAGLHNIALLEEPQAVCYDWYARHQASAAKELAEIPLILVCDIGGGTTDLSLISAATTSEQLALNRIGVGDHLMLGGDNLDLALAHLAESRFKGSNALNATALTKLIQQTRQAKEQLLSSQAPDEVKVTLLGSGSKLLGGTRSVAITKQEVHQIALEGFFPLSLLTDTPDQRRSAMVEFGLPYVADPAVSKHIAQFLAQHQAIARQAAGQDGDAPCVPVGLLLNGGAFNSDLITGRITQLLENWRGSPITLLDNPHPDWSVALGAVAYGKARRGAQLKIGGGSPRSYFLHLPEKNKRSKALCLLAKGTEEGQEIRLSSRRFSLTLGEPVRFMLLTSPYDELAPGTTIRNGLLSDIDPEKFAALPPYVTTLAGDDNVELAANQKQRVEVILASQLTEVGTLQLECVNGNDDSQRWTLEFDVRGQTQSTENHNDTNTVSKSLSDSLQLISKAYSGNKNSTEADTIKTLTKSLEKKLGKRDQWDFDTLRQLYDAFALGKKRRRRSMQHEQTWLRLTGYAMRPGFGAPTDSWRMEQLWPIYQQGIQFSSHATWSDWWTFWRRVGGGLNQEQQETILADIAKYLHPGSARAAKNQQESHDRGYEAMVRLAASLEHLHPDDKVLLATWFLKKATSQTDFVSAHWWALGRLASRVPFYGSAHNVVSREQVQQWLPKLLSEDWNAEPMAGFATMMMCRKTGDRTRDISEDLRATVIEKLRSSKVPDSWVGLVAEVTQLSESESKRAFGDALPNGLILIN